VTIDAIVIRRDALEKTNRRTDPRLAVGSKTSPARGACAGRHLTAVGLCAEVGEFQRFQKGGTADEATSG